LREDQLVVGKQIGLGAYAVVYKGTYMGAEVAIKKYKVRDPKSKEAFNRELEIISRLRHPNII